MLHPPNAIRKHTHAWHVRINTVIVRREVHAHGCKLRIVSVAISNQAHSSYRSMTTSRQALYYASSTRLHAQKDASRSTNTPDPRVHEPFMSAPMTILPHSHTMSMLLHRGHVRITIFSKFFSQLPHGTCFLSVSDMCQYFDEI